MAFSQDYLDFVLEQFEEFGGVAHKKMFGGVGFYKEAIMFGGIMGGSLHLKVDDETRPEFEAKGMTPFFHNKKKKGMASYYEVPVEIVEDKTELAKWAAKAFVTAKKSKKK